MLPIGRMLGFSLAQGLHRTAADASGQLWATAILSAILGAIVGVLLSALYGGYQRRRRFVVLLLEVAEELATIQRECDRRLAADTGIAGSIETPLPTEAWRALVASGDLGMLDPAPLRSLRKLFSLVVAANHVAAQWCCLLQIAILSPDERTRDDFNTSAARTLTEPCTRIRSELGGVIIALDTDIQGRQTTLNRIPAWVRERV